MSNIYPMILPMIGKTVEFAPIGTNLGLYYVLCALIHGYFLESRGGIFPALARLRLPDAVVRRSWAAVHQGGWQMGVLLVGWRKQVEGGGRWQPVRLDGYRLKAGDMSAVFRPRLRASAGQHYHPVAERALPAVECGLCVEVGKVENQIVPLPALLLSPQLRTESDAPSSTAQLKQQLIAAITAQQATDELYLFDPEFTLSELFVAGLQRFVCRQAKNCVARRNQLPPSAKRGRPPEYGEYVRPLARHYRKNAIPATPCDETFTAQEQQRTLTFQLWHNLVCTTQKVAETAPTFTMALIHDPKFKEPWLLASSVPLSHAAWQVVYRFRWTVERPPLIAKSLLGAQRQFFHSTADGSRFFALSLLAACLLAYFAAILPPIPSGFWDRKPKATAGRLRRLLASLTFPTSFPLPERLRLKASPTSHLLKGIFAHRRSKALSSPSP
jgi:hypothetical protein